MLLRSSTVCISILLICSILFVDAGIGVTSISSAKSINNVIIDGKWTKSDEWDDAKEYPIIRKNSITDYILIKDDDEYLYVMVDYATDKIIDNGDIVILRFDTEGDKASAPQSDDYVISLKWTQTSPKKKLGPGLNPTPDAKFSVSESIYQGNGKGWSLISGRTLDIEAAVSNEAENDPYNKWPHLIYEFAISKENFNGEYEIGFSIHGEDWNERLRCAVCKPYEERDMNLPFLGNNLDPSTWAILSFATF